MIDPTVIEAVAKQAHESWRSRKAEAGVTTCTSTKSGKELMVDYDQVDEQDKQENRDMITAVLHDVVKAGFTIGKLVVEHPPQTATVTL
jgi:hypothetical protein